MASNNPSEVSHMKYYLQFFLMVVALCIVPSLSIADPVAIFDFKDRSCGAWARSQENQSTRQVYLYWLRGFVSGYNFGSETDFVPLNAMPDLDTMSLYVDKYCRESPLSSFSGAGFQLVKELRVKK